MIEFLVIMAVFAGTSEYIADNRIIGLAIVMGCFLIADAIRDIAVQIDHWRTDGGGKH